MCSYRDGSALGRTVARSRNAYCFGSLILTLIRDYNVERGGSHIRYWYWLDLVNLGIVKATQRIVTKEVRTGISYQFVERGLCRCGVLCHYPGGPDLPISLFCLENNLSLFL